MNRKSDLWMALAALACLAVLCVRAGSVFHNGTYAFTSGMEEESLFAIWKWIHHQPVSGNAFAPPFAQSYFNWLFYWIYGAVGGAALWIGGLESSALPTIARCLTLALTIATGLVVFQLLAPLNFARRIAGSAIIAFNPLVGFWSLTTRPDVGALALGMLGAWCIGKSEKARSSAMWVGLAFLAFYFSWAFKQTYLVGFAATFFHFLLARKWKTACWFLGAAVSAIGLTVALGTAEYRYATLMSQSHIEFLPSLAGNNALKAILKAPMMVPGLVSVVVCLRRDKSNLLALWGMMATPLMLVASAKAAASDNYFFEPAAICSILFLLEGRHVTFGALAQLLSPVLIAAGLVGVLFVKPEPELALLRGQLAQMKGTVFVTRIWANLPWFQERPPYLVLATTYLGDRDIGKPFAEGGVQGMIRSGRIQILVTPRDRVNLPFDGIVPASLTKIHEDAAWVYFATRPSEDPANFPNSMP